MRHAATMRSADHRNAPPRRSPTPAATSAPRRRGAYLLGSFAVPADVIRREILPRLDAPDLVNLSSCSRGHRAALVAGDDDDERDGDGWHPGGLWRALHRRRWRDSDSSRRRSADAAARGHGRAGTYWYSEYARRHRLDASVEGELVRHARSLQASTIGRPGQAWTCLLLDGGRDVADALRSIIVRSDAIASARGAAAPTRSSGGADASRDAEELTDVEGRCHAAEMGRVARSVLVGINRLDVCREWMRMIESDRTARTLRGDGGELNDGPSMEDRAILIARFYLTPSRLLEMDTMDGLSDRIHAELDGLAAVLSSRLEKRCGLQERYPIPVILDEMKSLFGAGTETTHSVREPCFAGNQENYYDYRNSLLDRVLETGRGIPITLAVVYGAIVRRATGIALDPIGLPGHFVLGAPLEPKQAGEEKLFVDAFSGAKILTLNQVKALVRSYGVDWDDRFVAPAPYEEVWQRMVRNLVNCHDVQRVDAHPPDLQRGEREERAMCKLITRPLKFLAIPTTMMQIMTDEELLKTPVLYQMYCDYT